MYVTIITTIDYEIYTENDNFLNKHTDKENNIDMIIPTIILTTPCDLSFLRLMSLMVYTLIKTLFNNN